ncbi:thioredoxin family protein [Uliginosibacterium sediminicola]|jgi:thioredoxin 1|uniref:Thioredoxin family protein n=1 Tax=Uliginosibacterium sediminicola TaxID=2024550 RepID=A0ABU9Z3J7_9RHOO
MVLSEHPDDGFFVACLCAAWCGSCREYRPEFDALAARMPQLRFAWVDIEDEPEVAGDIDVENFPTLVIQRGELVLFCGAMLPHIGQLERLIQTFLPQSLEESRRYALGSAERRDWQGLADVQARLK